MLRPISSKYRSFFHYVAGILLVISFASCSHDASQQSVVLPAGTGGISFSLEWQRPLSTRAKSRLSPSFDACVDNGVDTLAATVYDDDTNTLVKSDSWPCSAHQGVIAGILAGPNYRVEVDGMSSGLSTWHGLASAITVTTGLITDAGAIVMSYTGGDTTKPTVTNIDLASSTTTSVPVTVRITITFSEPMAASTVNATTITLLNSGSTSTVPGIVNYDAAGNTASFTPAALLDYNTQYALGITTGITDIANNQLVSGYTTTFMTEDVPISVPEAPSGVAAQPGNGQVVLSWPAVNGATSYTIYYGLSSGVTTSNGTPISSAYASFIHMGLTNNQAYYYIVTAENSIGTSQASPEINATPMVDSLAAGLVGYYPFNGNANDASGNSNNGTVSSATLTTDRFGYGGSAYSFDGSTSNISLGNLGAINDYSVSLWFKKGVASSYPAAGEADLFGTQTSVEPWQYFKFGFDASYQDQIKVSIATTSSDVRAYTTPVITDTNWHLLVVTRLTETLQAYVDGAQLNNASFTTIVSAGTPSGPITSGNETKLGTVGGISDTIFNGVLDDVRIYGRALSADEISRLFYDANPNVPSPPANLIATPGSGQNVITWTAVAGATSYNLYWSTTPITNKTEADHVIRDVTSPYPHTGLTIGQTLYYVITAANSFGESSESLQAAGAPF
jgi:hypothetical protein